MTDSAAEAATSQVSAWLWLLPRLRRWWRRTLPIALALGLQVTFATLFPLGVKLLIDDALAVRNDQALVTILAGLVGLFAASTLLGVIGDWFTAQVAVLIINDARLALYRHLQTLSPGFFARMEPGELMSRFTNDFAALEVAIARALPNLLCYALQVVVSVLLLFALDWRLALVTLVSLPLSVVGPRVLGGRASRAGYHRRSGEARVATTLQEALSGQVVARAFGLEPWLRERVQDELASLSTSSSRALFLSVTVGRSTSVGVTIVELLIVGVGVLLLYDGLLTTGALVAFIGLVLNIDAAVSHLSQSLPEWLQAPVSIQRIEQIVRELPQVDDAAGAVSAPRLARSIRFQDVTFGYDPRHPIIRDVTLEILAGQSLAIIGLSGSGKSTLMNLLARFYDPDQGAISLDGINLRSVGQASLRAQIGMVFQDSFLFNTSVRENIRLGRPGASEIEIVQAARAAQVHDAIVNLPAGYETDVGDRGSRLSGGQRQRVALARAIIREPAILLLDEATSALDPAAEVAFNTTLRQLREGRTVISVTHRLATALDMDRILVMHNGRLVQDGAHDDLVRCDGVYRSLWEQQSGVVLSADGRRAEVMPARLRAIPLLADVDELLLASVAASFVTQQYPAGTAIMEEGEQGDTFCILVRGIVDVVRRDPGGGLQQIAALHEGDFFGEIALLSDVPRTATVRARTPCTVLSLARDEFQRLVASSAPLRDAVAGAAGRRQSEHRR